MRHEAIVILRNPHNHPMHPSTKPSAEDKFKLGMAVKSTGLTGLMVQKLLNATSTSSVYGGQCVTERSPVFADPRKVHDFISMQKKAEHPHGMGWEGVLHHLNTKEGKLLKSEQYIFTAMSKNGFWLVITMHPQIAMLIHQVLSLVIDFIFKQVEGKMDEWEVVGIVERFKKLSHVTGERFKLAPFYPDATCWAVILDGEVPQAQGFGDFLTTYNNPKISQIQTSDPLELLPNSLKTCCLHFEQHIEELPQNIPKYVIAHLKSILGLKPKEEIDNWHAFCASQEDPAIKSQELVLMEHDGVTPNRWNGSAQCEKLSGQRKKWEAHKAAIRNSQLTSYDTLKEERDSGAEENKASLERQRKQIIALRKDVEAEMSIRREWAVHRAEIDKEIQRLRDSRLAGARLKGRRPSEHPVGDDVPLVAADEGDGARMGTTDDHLDVGLQAFKSNSPVHVNDTVPELNSGHCVLGVLPPDHVTEFNSRFNANMNQNVLLDDLGTVNHPNQYAVQDLNFFPFSLQDDSFSMFNSNGLGTNFLHKFRANMNSDLPVSMFTDAGPAPAEYVNYTFHDGLHISGKQSADDLEYISSPTIDLVASALGPGELVHGIESGMENRLARWSGLWLSQELPGLAPPLSTPPSAGTEPDQSIANENVVDPQPEDDDIAPRDINLAFNEQNIVTGKCRCTQSSCVTDPNAADARPTKKRDQNSTSLKLWEVFWEFNFMVMRVQEFNFLIATSRDGHGNSTSIFIVVYHPNIENDLAQGSV
ncbi:hypothetical protein B0H10DRAFT_2196215 [Mycena sp. CBHHK59/15]|nr:hypothetical protein B0H10DRAFT_2196215 [Mycena sp. CBHHK59/15]